MAVVPNLHALQDMCCCYGAALKFGTCGLCLRDLAPGVLGFRTNKLQGSGPKALASRVEEFVSGFTACTPGPKST